MKVIYSIIQVFVFVITSNAQVLNGNFEEWSSGEPLYWISNNLPPQWAPITQTTDAHSGNFALKGEALATGIPNFTYTPFIQALFPFTGRPERVTGYFKLVSSAGDGFGVTVALMKNGQPVGSGGFGTTNVDTAYQQFVAPMFYQDSTTTPDTILFIISMFSPNPNIPIAAGSAYYLDDISTLTITKPKVNELFVAGEKDTIRWSDEAIENVNLYYSLDEGANFTPIIMNHPMDSLKYIWDVPSNLLSRKAVIKIEESENTINNSLGPVYRIKPWQLSQVNSNDDYEQPLFTPGNDGWLFGNSQNFMWPSALWQQFDYQNGVDPNTAQFYPFITPFDNASASDFVDWEVFVDVFGIAQCYHSATSTPAKYKAKARTKWAGVKGAWGGSCYGFAVTSLLAYYHKAALLNRFPGIGNFISLIDANFSDESRKAINNYFTFQFGDPFKSYDNNRWNTVDARQNLKELKEMFELDNGDAKPLAFYSNDSTNPGGHEVTPYKLERIGTSSSFNLRVYDSNAPGSTNQIIKIDSAANTWTDLTGLGWGTGKTRCFLELPSGQYLTTPILPKNSSLGTRLNSENMLDISRLEIYTSNNGSTLFTNSNGESVGYVDSTLINTMQNAFPIIPRTGRTSPPIGYIVDEENYSVSLNNYSDNFSYLFFLTDSTIYNYRRYDADAGQSDRIYYNNGLIVKNPNQQEKILSLESAIIEETSEKLFIVDNLSLGGNDSISVQEKNRKELLFKNFGVAKNYRLKLEIPLINEMGEFMNTSVSMNENSSHLIIPNWENLITQPVLILVDSGNDGTIDDTLEILNQITSVDDDQGSMLTPDSYNLAQNYPNPFNPTTKISWQTPVGSHQTLKIYDVLGNEVATLVDEFREAGRYEITFDASNLASGIYFYRLNAGSFVETKKMILIK